MAEEKKEPVTIKKYANRRLYNTGTSAYVTLEDLASMVKQGEDFIVYDAKTGEDITRSVLAQIIFEQENKEGQSLLPITFLRQLIRFYGDSMQMLVPRFLEASIESLSREQDKFREQMAQAFGVGAFGPLEDQVRRAVEQGATVVAGGKRNGNYFEPTVLTDITPENDIYREELFGPVAQVYRVRSEEEAVELSNDTPFGLGSYVMTNDSEQAERVADQIDAGMVYVNIVGADAAETPFGGTKRSGFGREALRFGGEEHVTLEA